MTRLAVVLLLVTGCTLPGYQGGPMPRATQYTYPGRTVHPETGLARPATIEVAEGADGIYAYGLVFRDGTTGRSVDTFGSHATCEQGRVAYDAVIEERVKEGGARVMTVKCFRTHDTAPGQQTR